MKVVCVTGGSYKSFYINHLVKLQQCDLLIFNYGIIYDYVTKDELFGNGLITKELLHLSSRLSATIVAGAYVIEAGKKYKAVIVCDEEKIHIYNVSTGAKIQIKDKVFLAGDEKTKYKNYHKIVLGEKKITPNLNHCVKNKIYIFCDKFGVTFVQNKKNYRKFYKYSKMILN